MKRKTRTDQPSFYEILGEPLLANATERSAFLKYRELFERELQPRDAFEYQEVQDMALRRIESLRYERAQVGLIQSPFEVAAELRFVLGDAVDEAQRTALDYCSDNAEISDGAKHRVADSGLRPDQIESRLIATQLEKVEALDRLRRSRDDAIRRAIFGQKKRNQKRAKADVDLEENDRKSQPTERKRQFSVVADKAKVGRH